MTSIAAAAILSLVVMLSLLEAEVLAVTCNKCESDLDSRCGASLTYNPPTCYDTTCFTFTGTFDGTYVIVRDCLSSSGSGCTSVNTYYQGSHIVGTYCFCQYGYCNGGQWSGGNLPTTTTTTRTTRTSTPAPAVTDARWLTCYKCNSLSNSQCANTQYSASPATSCENKMCYTFAGTIDGTYVIVRDCMPSSGSGCTSVNAYSQGSHIVGNYCFCQYGYCNGGQWSGGSLPTTATITPAPAVTYPRWLTCYKCNSLSNSQCANTQYSASDSTSCENKMCYMFTGTVDGTKVVLRDCTSSTTTGCGSGSYISGGVTISGQYCYCASNYCNDMAAGGNAVDIVRRESVITIIAAVISVRFFV